jgi:hypothetical protein
VTDASGQCRWAGSNPQNSTGGTAQTPAIGTLRGKAVLLVGFPAHERLALAAEVRRQGGVIAHTAGSCDCAIVQGEAFAASLRNQGIPIVELEPAAVGGAA